MVRRVCPSRLQRNRHGRVVFTIAVSAETTGIAAIGPDDAAPDRALGNPAHRLAAGDRLMRGKAKNSARIDGIGGRHGPGSLADPGDR